MSQLARGGGLHHDPPITLALQREQSPQRHRREDRDRRGRERRDADRTVVVVAPDSVRKRTDVPRRVVRGRVDRDLVLSILSGQHPVNSRRCLWGFGRAQHRRSACGICLAVGRRGKQLAIIGIKGNKQEADERLLRAEAPEALELESHRSAGVRGVGNAVLDEFEGRHVLDQERADRQRALRRAVLTDHGTIAGPALLALYRDG